MAEFTVGGVRIAGISTAVPGRRLPVEATTGIGSEEIAKVIANTGVSGRHIACETICTSDLCFAAAERLLQSLGWDRETVDLLILVTQTPDYVLPATACALHGRLGLSKFCAAFDLNLGCSGYVYGLSIASLHLQAGAAKRALVLVGDTINKLVSQQDRSVAFLFGDAGSATALEFVNNAPPMHFITASDGSGAAHLEVPAGLFRNPSTEQTRVARVREGGNVRSDEQLRMNGPEIFNFTIRELPPLINRTLARAEAVVEDVDAFVFHQANRFMLNYLAKRMKLPLERVIFGLEQFGNTSSASIPLAICDQMRGRLANAPATLVLAGFGVGFSWASAFLSLDGAKVEPVIFLEG